MSWRSRSGDWKRAALCAVVVGLLLMGLTVIELARAGWSGRWELRSIDCWTLQMEMESLLSVLSRLNSSSASSEDCPTAFLVGRTNYSSSIRKLSEV